MIQWNADKMVEMPEARSEVNKREQRYCVLMKAACLLSRS